MNYGVKQQDILALSPYQAQCRHIHSKLQANKLNGVKCTTVKSSEGRYYLICVNYQAHPLLPFNYFIKFLSSKGFLHAGNFAYECTMVYLCADLIKTHGSVSCGPSSWRTTPVSY